jgi:hypothetical protein
MIALARPARVVREGGDGYEAEGSERRSVGSIATGPGAWWSATLSAPVADGGVVFVQLERHGPRPAGYRGSEEAADFSVPAGEVDALLALLAGVVAQARRDGVLDALAGPGRTPCVGDRVFWAGDARYGRREGTVTAVYGAPRGARYELRCDITWDPPPPTDPAPWEGTSRGFPAWRLHTPGWGWV